MIPVAMGTFISTLDSSIVNVALPTITSSLGSDVATIEWVVIAYLLTITCILLTMGRIADLYGLRKLYAIGFVIFTVGSAFCGISTSDIQLIASRVLQGIGGSILMALGLAIITRVFPMNERGKALGIGGSIVSIGIMTGPVLGGLIISAAGWRWIFLINIPIGIIGAYAVMRILKKEEVFEKRRFDYLGGALLLVSIAALLLALNQGEYLGWSSPLIISLLAVFVAAFALFILVELRSSDPLMHLSIFRNRVFTTSIFASLIAFLVLFTVTIRMPFYLQDILNYEPWQIGLMLTAMPIAMSATAPMSGWVSDRIGSRLLTTIGMSVIALTMVLIAMLTANSTAIDIYVRLALLGVGMGIFASPNNNAIMSSVPRERMGMGSGMIATIRNTGMSLGIAFSGAFLAASCGLLGTQGSSTICVGGMQDLYLVSALICVLGVILAFSRGGPILSKPPEEDSGND
jgi:EmrB/QacA subfamily drug resistance transporter